MDDDDSILTVFSTTLKKEGIDVVTAKNAEEGLERAKSEKPNLILLDQVLPDMHGNQILGTLKNSSDTHNIPVAILSNFGQNELIEDAIKQGAADYILKYQIEPPDLVKKIKELTKEVK